MMSALRCRVAVLLLLAACGPAVAQETGGVEAAGLEATGLDVRAQITPRHFTILSSELAGRINQLPVREGEGFRKGQILAAIDCASYRAKLDHADALSKRAERKAQAMRLLDKRGVTGKVDLELAEIDLDAAEAERTLAAIDVARCDISAPFTGRVAALKVKNHQYVTLGEPIVEILSDRELEVELLAPSRWLAWLKPGARFFVRLDELGIEVPAVVDRLGAQIDPVSQSVKVYARPDGDIPALEPGMSGIARFLPPPSDDPILPAAPRQ